MHFEQKLLDSLYALEGVEQDPHYHPEGDVLYHSLQVFEWALYQHKDPELWAAALFHDVGKSIQTKHHALLGAQELHGIFPERVIWLVRHHMDLHYQPKQTRRKLHGTPELKALEQLRHWDLRGRDPHASVMEPEQAIAILQEQPVLFAL